MKGQQTQQRILVTAREMFAQAGYDGVSVRSIATSAGVDQALVHRYFGTKQALFLAATELPSSLDAVMGHVMDLPDDQLGAGLVTAAVTLWDSEAAPSLVSAARSVLSSPEGAPVVRDVVFGVILRDLPARVEAYGQGQRRVALVATQMVGLLASRKLLGMEGIKTMPVEEVAALIGPTIQRYLTGELPSGLHQTGDGR